VEIKFKETKAKEVRPYDSGEGEFGSIYELWRDEQTNKYLPRKADPWTANQQPDKSMVNVNKKMVFNKAVIKFNPEKDIYSGVYVIRSISGGPIKIGFSRDIGSRVREIESNHPYPLEILYVVRNVGTDFERHLHRRLKEYKIKGEWFIYNSTVKRKIEKLIKDCKFF